MHSASPFPSLPSCRPPSHPSPCSNGYSTTSHADSSPTRSSCRDGKRRRPSYQHPRTELILFLTFVSSAPLPPSTIWTKLAPSDWESAPLNPTLPPSPATPGIISSLLIFPLDLNLEATSGGWSPTVQYSTVSMSGISFFLSFSFLSPPLFLLPVPSPESWHHTAILPSFCLPRTVYGFTRPYFTSRLASSSSNALA